MISIHVSFFIKFRGGPPRQPPFFYLTLLPAGCENKILFSGSESKDSENTTSVTNIAIRGLFPEVKLILPSEGQEGGILGEIIFRGTDLHFAPNRSEDGFSCAWRLGDLREVHKRWFDLKDTAVELFFASGNLMKNPYFLKCEENNRILEKNRLLRRWKVSNLGNNFFFLTLVSFVSGFSWEQFLQSRSRPFLIVIES